MVAERSTQRRRWQMTKDECRGPKTRTGGTAWQVSKDEGRASGAKRASHIERAERRGFDSEAKALPDFLVPPRTNRDGDDVWQNDSWQNHAVTGDPGLVLTTDEQD